MSEESDAEYEETESDFEFEYEESCDESENEAIKALTTTERPKPAAKSQQPPTQPKTTVTALGSTPKPQQLQVPVERGPPPRRRASTKYVLLSKDLLTFL